ncbi:FecR domain-containing protein [Ekhidna sp.]|uniref:FecR family protein n=1 Tax=Ekhidna sp. TaxID=2608089 RepID=UPI00329A2BA7
MEEVLAKYFSGEASKDEISLVENWRSESKSNAESFFEAKSAWLISEPETPPPSHILSEILEEPHGKQVPFILQSWVKYASAAVLVLAISLLFILNQTGESNVTNEFLTDGSEIVLHEDSRLEIIAFDESIREVRVTGKAYFDIERDESRPFVIHTPNAKVEVLGTSFVVDAYGSKTEVSVETGVVSLSKNLNGSDAVSVKLEKGETGLVTNTNTGIIKKNNRDLNYLAWKTKVISFDESSMAEVIQVIEDVYGIDVTFENPSFKECKLTAKFNKKKAKDAIEIIARTFGIEYEYSNGKAILKGKGC